jgi:hypothetical protein
VGARWLVTFHSCTGGKKGGRKALNRHIANITVLCLYFLFPYNPAIYYYSLSNLSAPV